jgi:hypothetical protein
MVCVGSKAEIIIPLRWDHDNGAADARGQTSDGRGHYVIDRIKELGARTLWHTLQQTIVVLKA